MSSVKAPAAVTGVFNDGYIAEQFEAYANNPASVDESWRQFFRFAEQLARRGGGVPAGSAPDAALLRKAASASALADAIRAVGHLAVALDPLGTAPPGSPELTPEYHGLTDADLAAIPADVLSGPGSGTAADVIARLRTLYSSTLGIEFEHVGAQAERAWLREAVESGVYHQPLSADEQIAVLRRLTAVDALERFLGRAYQGYKRFSIEGSDVLVVMLDEVIQLAAQGGSREVAIAMAHRGRINVLAHIMGASYANVFDEFEGKHAAFGDDMTGDVKYHLGADGSRDVAGTTMALSLVPNPSHLEMVNPVLAGVVRAKQRVASRGETPGAQAHDETAVIPICIHGDAAFPGEGVVAETFNLASLRGYRIGGTIHIIVNNQVGFTTDPLDGRSTRYASDLAKGFDVPILHVNGDDAAACVQATRLAAAYRAEFRKDVLIDLVSYRRHGHNETDEPAFTQPELYQRVRAHNTPREVWGAQLVREGVISESDAQTIEREITTTLEQLQSGDRPGPNTNGGHANGGDANGVQASVATAVPADRLIALNEQLLQWPQGFNAHPRLAKTLARRRNALQATDGTAGGIDWGHAETLALGALLADGVSVRLTGQDAERGTFSHRQGVLHDAQTGQTYTPLQHIPGATGTLELYNSPLSEMAVLGFEYGYSVTARDALVLWEAQYGDFANVAQAIIDQFISADRAKWNQTSGVTMLLPHGYEGGGPEHSSARLERYLQLCAEDNMRVAYPSTPAQYFHILRRQAMSPVRRPLVLMQPKSLLRLPEAASVLADLTSGAFRPVIDDPAASRQREHVRRLVFCTGKIYYDLLAKRTPEQVAQIALVRVEELYPWPHDDVARVVDAYPAIEDVVWAQEEPKNMGAWSFVWPRLRVSTGNAIPIRYMGRPERASPAEGYSAEHTVEQQRIVTEVLAVAAASREAVGKRAKVTTR